MSEENGLAAFSIRIPTSLATRIEDRAKFSRRSRNAEITLLLEQALDLHTMRDLRLLEEMKNKAKAVE